MKFEYELKDYNLKGTVTFIYVWTESWNETQFNSILE